MRTSRSDVSGRAADAPAELVALAAHVGANPMWVQGAGGNVSAKLDDVLWIKGSGKWMSSAHAEPIFAAVKLSGVRNRMAAGEADPARAELLPISPPGLRPSIETSMHALLTHEFVAHVHSVNVIAHSVCAEGHLQVAERLQGLSWGWVPYVRPGVDLTNAIFKLRQPTAVEVLILANHGLIVGGASRSAVEMLLDEVEARLNLPARTPPVADVRKLYELSVNTPYHPPQNAELHAMAIDPVQRSIAVGGSLYPDHVVFLGPGVSSLGDDRNIGDLLQKHERLGLEIPAVLLVPGVGVLLRKNLTAAAVAMVECLAMVLARVPNGSTVRYLTRDQELELLDWDAEKYRQSLSQRELTE